MAKLDEIYGRKIAEFEGMEKLQKGLEDHNTRLTKDAHDALQKFDQSQRQIKSLMQELQVEKNRNVNLRDEVNRLQLQVDESKKTIDYLEGEITKEKERADNLQSKNLE